MNSAACSALRRRTGLSAVRPPQYARGHKSARCTSQFQGLSEAVGCFSTLKRNVFCGRLCAKHGAMITSTAASGSSSTRILPYRKHFNTPQDTMPNAECQNFLITAWSSGSSSSTDSASMLPKTPTVTEKSHVGVHTAFRPKPNAQIFTDSSIRRSACIATTVSPTAPAAAAAAVGLPQCQPRSMHSGAAMHKFAKALAEAGIRDPAVLAFADADGTYPSPPAAVAAVASDNDAANDSSSVSSSAISTQEFADGKQSIQQLATALAQAGLQDPGLDMLAQAPHKIATAINTAAAAPAPAAPAAARDPQVQKEELIDTNSSSNSGGNSTWIQKLVAIERRLSSSSSSSSKGSGMISEALKNSAAAAAVPSSRLLLHRRPSVRLDVAAAAAAASSSSSSSRYVSVRSTQGPKGQRVLANSSSSSSSCQVEPDGIASWVQALAAKDKLPGNSSTSSSKSKANNCGDSPSSMGTIESARNSNSSSSSSSSSSSRRKISSSGGRAGNLRPSPISPGSFTGVKSSSTTRSDVKVHLKRRSTSSGAEVASSSSSSSSSSDTTVAKIAGSPIAVMKKGSRSGKSAKIKRHWLHRLAACTGSSTLSYGGMVSGAASRAKAA